MKELFTEVEIAASPEVVWDILTDFESYSDWNPFITRASGKVEAGAQLEIYIEPPGAKPMTFKPTVKHVDPGKSFRWLGRVMLPGIFDGLHVFELSKHGEGGTRLIHREEFRGFMVPLLWKSLDTQTRAGFEAMNAALKERAEQAA